MTEYYARAGSARDILQDKMGDSFHAWVWYIQAENNVLVSFGKMAHYRADEKDYHHVNVVFEKSYTVDEFMNTDVESFVNQAILDYTFGVSQ